MTGTDTNLLVRYLVRDDEEQSVRVLQLLDSGEVLFINSVVLCELYWVLHSVYNYSGNEFVTAIDALLETDGFQFFDTSVVKAALADYIHTNVGFSDCLIHRMNLEKKMKTKTFDVKASALEGMTLV